MYAMNNEETAHWFYGRKCSGLLYLSLFLGCSNRAHLRNPVFFREIKVKNRVSSVDNFFLILVGDLNRSDLSLNFFVLNFAERTGRRQNKKGELSTTPEFAHDFLWNRNPSILFVLDAHMKVI